MYQLKREKVIIFNFLGHLIIGSIVGLFIAQSPLVFFCILFGSLLPDIDLRTSTLARYNIFSRWMTHRGHCHSLLDVLLLAFPFILFGIVAYEFIALGAVVHILSDKLFSWFPKKQGFELKMW